MKTSIEQLFDPTEHLSKELLNRYAHGQLEKEELFQAEKHLIDCPLCESAAEGAILLKQKGKKVRSIIRPNSITSPTFYWKAVAAMLIIVLSIGGLLKWQEGREGEIAQEKIWNEGKIQPREPALSDGSSIKKATTIESIEKEKQEIKTIIPSPDQLEIDVPLNEEKHGNTPQPMLEDLALVDDESQTQEFAAVEKPMTHADEVIVEELSDEKSKDHESKTKVVSEKEVTKKALSKTRDTDRAISASKTPTAAGETTKSQQESSEIISLATTTDAAKMVSGASQSPVLAIETIASHQTENGQTISPYYLFNEALESYQNKDYQEAIRGFSRLESHTDYRGLALYYKAQCMIKTARFAKAKLLLEQLIKLPFPESIKAQKTLDSLKANRH